MSGRPFITIKQRGERADDAPGLGADQFGRIGIALLRHDGGAGGELVGEFHEAELRGRPQDDLFGQRDRWVAQMAAGRKQLQHEIAVGHGIQ